MVCILDVCSVRFNNHIIFFFFQDTSLDSKRADRHVQSMHYSHTRWTSSVVRIWQSLHIWLCIRSTHSTIRCLSFLCAWPHRRMFWWLQCHSACLWTGLLPYAYLIFGELNFIYKNHYLRLWCFFGSYWAKEKIT